MLECKQRNLQNKKKVSSKMKSNCHGPQDQYPQGVYKKKELIFEKKWEEKRKIFCVYIGVQTKRAIQHLHDEFQIENINKNYGHANVHASDKSLMRTSGLPREKNV